MAFVNRGRSVYDFFKKAGLKQKPHRRWGFAVSFLECKLFAFLHCRIAFAAVNRSVACGLERNLSFFSAVCADCSVHFSLGFACILLCVAAALTSLGLVLETLFSIEFLLAGCEYEFSSTILANQCFVLIHLFYLALFCMKNILP